MKSDYSAPGEEPPIVTDLLLRASRRVTGVCRGVLARVDRKVMLALWGIGTIVIFAGVLVLSIVQSPDLSGVLSGVFGGLFLALLFAGGMAWLVMSMYGPGRRQKRVDTARETEFERLLAPTLRELDLARAQVVRQVKGRSITRVPAGIAGAAALWLLGQSGSEPGGVIELAMWMFVGGLAGELWAIGKLDREYRRLYKSRVLPQLAKRFGDLTYRHASTRDIAKLRTHRILTGYDRVTAEDEFVGTWHGLPVSIIEARLECGSGKDTRVVFDGLLIDVTLPRTLTGTTIVAADAGLVGNLRAQWRSDGLERVSLEDPRFEKLYEVYSNDQIEARALLTPAFMERFMALGSLSGLAPPGALAEHNRLVTALPKRMAGDLFEPPPYWKASGGRVLVALSEDIRAVLAMVDSVIELDFWAAGRKRAHAGVPGILPEPAGGPESAITGSSSAPLVS